MFSQTINLAFLASLSAAAIVFFCFAVWNMLQLRRLRLAKARWAERQAKFEQAEEIKRIFGFRSSPDQIDAMLERVRWSRQDDLSPLNIRRMVNAQTAQRSDVAKLWRDASKPMPEQRILDALHEVATGRSVREAIIARRTEHSPAA